MGRFPERDSDFERSNGMQPPGRRKRLLRVVRPLTPMVVRFGLVLLLGGAAIAPGYWTAGAGVVHDAYALGLDRPPELGPLVSQGNPETTATPTMTVDPATLPIDTATPTPPLPPPWPSPSPATPTPYVGDPCWGDEQITYIPEQPRTNNEMIVAVTSSRPHPYGRVAGTEKTTFVRERPGQLGYVWEWSVALTWPGRHRYVFYVDSTIPCKEFEVLVRQQYVTPTPDPYNTNGNEADGDLDEDNGNEA